MNAQTIHHTAPLGAFAAHGGGTQRPPARFGRKLPPQLAASLAAGQSLCANTRSSATTETIGEAAL